MINLVYVALALAFSAVVLYTVLHSLRLKTRTRTMETMGRPPVSLEEGIAIATAAEERRARAHRHG